jgi:hypothetical protein
MRSAELLIRAAYGGLPPAPASRWRGTYPHLSRRLLRHTKVRHPEPIGRPRLELSIDAIQRARRGLILDRWRTGLPRMTPCRPKPGAVQHGGMPMFILTSEQRDDIIAYILSLR